MDPILEILSFTIPSVVVFLTAFFLLRSFFKNEDKKRKFELSMNYKESILPLRLQAYERLILLLERISPDSLVMRISGPDMTVIQLQAELISAIRSEFEHNLAQQTYISSSAWEMVKAAKNSMIKMVNESASEFKPDGKGINLSKSILENSMELKSSPVYAALEFLKKEVRELF